MARRKTGVAKSVLPKRFAKVLKMNSPEDLPLITQYELPHEGSYRLNPFTYGDYTYRIVGYNNVTKMYGIKRVETGEYGEKTKSWLDKISTK